MPLFGRRRHPDPAVTTPAPPPAVSVAAADLEMASQVINSFFAAMGSDAKMRQAALHISQVGGAPKSLEEGVRRQARGDDPGWDRPWLWLLAVARQAAAAQRVHLLAEIALFITFWQATIAPNLTLADQMDMMLGSVPAPVLAEIQTLARSNLGLVDPATVVSENQTGTITMGYLLDVLCAA